jgi:hypothetical protein
MKQPYTPLPWHYSEEGFSRNNPVPTIYATNTDLEIVARVPFDGLLHKRFQDNKANAEYIHQACNNFPEAIELLIKAARRCSQTGTADDINEFLNKLN